MSEKNLPPTPRRRGEARAEGRVARSVELNAAATLLVGAWLLNNAGGRILGDIKNLLIYALSSIAQAKPGMSTSQADGAWILSLFLPDLQRLVSDMGFIIISLLLVGATVTISQTGLLWAKKALGFKLNRLNPLNGLKRIFSANGLVEFLKATLKLLVVGWVAYSFLQSHISDLFALAQTDFLTALQRWAELAISMGIRVGSAYLALAFADYYYKRWQFKKSMYMSREEIKEDMRRSEGDPFIKSRIRGQQRRMARMRMMAHVHKADVVITNPTHLAVAVQYKAEEMNAPKVLAKGPYKVAERIVEIARRNNIPVIQNIPVARALYRTVEVDQEIPPELYAALAEVLAYVYRVRGQPAIATEGNP
jgi:flagellar biosynthesis protein FlhB